MAMKTWFQWCKWYDDESGLKILNGYPNWESHFLATAKGCDGTPADDCGGGIFIWVGAIYMDNVSAGGFEIYTDPEEFHKDVENLKENGIIR